jgi:hypothetical protein
MSRLSSITDSTGVDVAFKYLGLGKIVEEDNVESATKKRTLIFIPPGLPKSMMPPFQSLPPFQSHLLSPRERLARH